MKTMIATAMALVLGIAAFGETWKDSNGITWEFQVSSSGYTCIAKITGATPAPKGAFSIPATVSDPGGYGTCTVTEIDAYAFYNNGGITSVAIPAGVTKIGYSAFGDCGKLKSVTFKGAPPSGDLDDVFYGTPFLDVAAGREGNGDSSYPRAISNASGEAKDDNFLAWDNTLTGAKLVKWFVWTAPKSGTVWFWTHGSNFNTFLGAYAFGSTSDIAHNDNFANGASLIAFPVTMGEKYTIYVGGSDPNCRGEFTLKWRMGTPVVVTFDTCGGVMDLGFGGDLAPYPKNAAAAALPTPEKEYYTFAGWYTKKSGGTKATTATKFTKETKLYARWSKKKLKVTVTKEKGGQSVKGSGSYAWGTKVKLSATAKSGYVFRAWGAVMEEAWYEASRDAFPNLNTQCRKNLTPTVTVPKDSQISYYASFVKKSEDIMAINVTGGSTTLYAEDGAGGFVELYAQSYSYPKVTTSKLPAGVKFSLLPPPESPGMGVIYDSRYRLEIADPDKVPAGKNVIKITAKNRSGKTATQNVVVWGKNRTDAIMAGVLSVFAGTEVRDPNEIYVGVKYKPSDWGVVPSSGWKISKIGGLPDGITWDAKSQKLKGYTKKTGLYTFSFTLENGKTKYVETATFKVSPLHDAVVGAFNGYATYEESGDSFIPTSIKFSMSVTKNGKVSAKVGNVSFSCDGLSYEPDGMKFKASMKSSYAKGKVTCNRSLLVFIDPYAECDENSLTGSYTSETKTDGGKHSYSTVELEERNVVGRRNVFECDDSGNPLFEDAVVARDALNVAVLTRKTSTIAFDEGSVTVTIDSSCNGVATLAGTFDGQPFSESAVIWYEPNPNNVRKAYLIVNSFSIGMPIIYVVTLDSSCSYVESVAAPGVPVG